MESKICNKCGDNKILDEFRIRKDRKKPYTICKVCENKSNKKYQEVNIEKINLSRKRYRIKNKDKLKEINKKHRDKNKEKVRLYAKIYREKNKENRNRKAREKLKSNPILKLEKTIRNSIRRSFKINNFKKPSKTECILGCSIEQYKIYIENKFDSWMSFDNHGNYNKNRLTWQLDHIIPISSAKTMEDAIRLNHYTNFQPLESMKNLVKFNKI